MPTPVHLQSSIFASLHQHSPLSSFLQDPPGTLDEQISAIRIVILTQLYAQNANVWEASWKY